MPVTSNKENREHTITWLAEHVPPLVPRGKLTETSELLVLLNQHISEAGKWQDKACEALPLVVQSNLLEPLDAFELIKTGLEHVHGLSIKSKNHLLSALAVCVLHPSAEHLGLESIVSRNSAGQLILDVLEASLRRTTDQKDDLFLISCLDMLAFLGYLPALATVQALSANHSQTKVREKARKTFLTLRDTVRVLWNDTPADLVTSVEERSSLLRRQLANQGLTELEQVQALFNCLKDSSFENNEDPRLPLTMGLLEGPDERLRLAACWALAQCGRKNSIAQEELIACLADVAVNGRREGCVREASAILDELETVSRQMRLLVAEARHRANLRFLESFKLTGMSTVRLAF